MIATTDVVDIHRAFTEAGIDYWIAGGWGVDALLGRQTREHADLDVLIRAPALDAVLGLLAARGFAPHTDWLPVRIQLSDTAEREIDVHPLVFEPDGSAWLPGLDGERYAYPLGSFVTGLIADTSVRCISAGLQYTLHQGYEPQEKDLADLAALATAGLLTEPVQ